MVVQLFQFLLKKKDCNCIVNLGDSDIVQFNSTSYEVLSDDHSPDNINEFKRMIEENPDIIFEYDKKQKNSIILASLGTFSTGINIRNIHNIIFASPSKSQIRVLQSIGRGLRISDDGRDTKLYDIADDIHWKGFKNYTLLHSVERVKIYSTEKFPYKITEIDI